MADFTNLQELNIDDEISSVINFLNNRFLTRTKVMQNYNFHVIHHLLFSGDQDAR
ncbi:predicted protein [Arabidopsis lyrata subsp. lyrata]|uniref:Predicted protein n=1 Tax=Arabidopsis lyrata subsp. lyrata TaxID=81972 RepID=D7MC17_ARALL|nr:predicted protein [Arabidopsis lyrata subsp. lyrata]